jgi:hypothetical protein
MILSVEAMTLDKQDFNSVAEEMFTAAKPSNTISSIAPHFVKAYDLQLKNYK